MYLLVKHLLTNNMVDDVSNLIIKLMIKLQLLDMMETDIINIIKKYYIIKHVKNKTYDLVGFSSHESKNKYDSITFIPNITKYQLNIKTSHYYDQSNFDRLRSRIDENIKGTKYQLVKGRRFRWCIEIK